MGIAEKIASFTVAGSNAPVEIKAPDFCAEQFSYLTRNIEKLCKKAIADGDRFIIFPGTNISDEWKKTFLDWLKAEGFSAYYASEETSEHHKSFVIMFD